MFQGIVSEDNSCCITRCNAVTHIDDEDDEDECDDYVDDDDDDDLSDNRDYAKFK